VEEDVDDEEEEDVDVEDEDDVDEEEEVDVDVVESMQRSPELAAGRTVSHTKPRR